MSHVLHPVRAEIEIIAIERAQLIARFFQVLSDPTRVRIVKALADKQWCVSDLAQALQMDQPAVSHQLKYLRQLGLVKWQKEGRHVHYILAHTLLHEVLHTAIDQLDHEGS